MRTMRRLTLMKRIQPIEREVTQPMSRRGRRMVMIGMRIPLSKRNELKLHLLQHGRSIQQFLEACVEKELARGKDEAA